MSLSQQPAPYTEDDLKAWTMFAETLADIAGTITSRHFKTELQPEHKDDNTPVTQADRETERALREAIHSRYPHHGILGEEYGMDNDEADLCWVLDPIDGTRAFIAGQPTFVTLIALTHHNVPIVGLIDQPIQNHRWSAFTGGETRFNGAAISVRNAPESLSEATIGTTGKEYFPEDAIQRFDALADACKNLTLGGDGYLYGQVASQKLHLVCEHGLKAHDFAALRNVVESAGGVMTDWDGKPLTLESDGRVIAAASEALHAQALAILQAK